jgi:chain length determinant protein EpsF
MTVQQMLILLRARSGFLWLTFAIIMLIAVAGTFFWPKSYLGSVSVLADSTALDPISGSTQPPQLAAMFMQTQLEIIASHNVALKVVDNLDLIDDPDLKAKYEEATGGQGDIKDWIADRLIKKNLDAHLSQTQPTKQNNVIDIDAYSKDPKMAADLANAFADGYVQTNLEMKMAPARRQASWFNEQVAALKKQMESAQARLSEFQQSHAVTGTDTHYDIENKRLQELADQLLTSQNGMYDAQTRLKQMNDALQQDKLQELPDIAGNQLLQTMIANLTIAEGKLAQISSSFGDNHPDYVSAEAQVKELRRKLLAQVDIAKGSIIQSAAIASRQVGELRQALDRQRDRVLQLKNEKDQQDVLKQQVDDAQHAYDAGVQRANQIGLESRLDQSSISVLNPAVTPVFAAYPKLFLNLVIGLLLGTILSPTIVIVLELMNMKVRSRIDLEQTAGIVVLAEMQHMSLVLTHTKRRFFGRRRPRIALNPQIGYR